MLVMFFFFTHKLVFEQCPLQVVFWCIAFCTSICFSDFLLKKMIECFDLFDLI